MPLGGLISGGVGLIGGLIGQNQATQAQRGAQDALERARAEIGKVRVPTKEELLFNIINPELVGEYRPEMEQLYELGPTSMEQISLDPKLREAQMAALSQIGGYTKEGFTPAEIAALEQIRRGTSAQSKSQQASILQDMAARGQAGSGAELAARLAASEGAVDRASQQALQLQQAAQQRALSALGQQASMATGIRGQEYGEQADLAKARDIINQFNVGQRQNVSQRNVGNLNQAQLANLQARQAIENQRAAARTAEQAQRADAARYLYQAELDKAKAKAGMAGSGAELAARSGEKEASFWGDLGSAGAKGLASMFSKPTAEKEKEE